MTPDIPIFRYDSVGFIFMIFADRIAVSDVSPHSPFLRHGGQGTIAFATIRDVQLDPRTHALRVIADGGPYVFILGNQAVQAHDLLRAALARARERQLVLQQSARKPRTGLVAAIAALLILGVIVAAFVTHGGGLAKNSTPATTTPPASPIASHDESDPTQVVRTAGRKPAGTPAPTAPPFDNQNCANKLCVHFIDVGQGDSIFLRAPDGTTALIDGGDPGSGALAYLQSQHVTRIDLMFLTHPHQDHIGGLIDVLNALPVGQVITTGATNTTRVYERFLNTIANRKVPYKEVARDDVIAFGSLHFTVLHAVRTAPNNNLNETSLVLKLEDNAVSFLFTGDAESLTEQAMLKEEAGKLQATVLKVGHHGSRTSSSPAFLAAVKPQIAIYSAGLNNIYGHPAPATIANLRNIGAQIYGTNVHGTVVVVTDGLQYHVLPHSLAPPIGSAP